MGMPISFREITSYRPSERDIAEFEKLLAARLPADYGDFLTRENGGEPSLPSYEAIDGNPNASSSVRWFYAIGSGLPSYYDLTLAYRESRMSLPAGLVPIAPDSFGNEVCLCLADGSIHFWDHEHGEGETGLYPLDMSFSSFLAHLKPAPVLPNTTIEQACLDENRDYFTELARQRRLNEKDKYDRSAAEIAVRYEKAEVLRFLISLGADLHGALKVACQNDYAEMARILLDAGVSPDETSVKDSPTGGPRSALLLAVVGDSTGVVRLLLERGAKPGERELSNARNKANIWAVFRTFGYK